MLPDMRVEQAVYGEVDGRGHGLRVSSSNSSVAASLATRLDLPDSVPQGVQAWSPFVRGFPCDDHYVLARTFLDSGSSRGGMVLTHALIANLDDICQADNLAVMFERLAASTDNIPDQLPAFFEGRAQSTVGQVAWRLEGQNIDGGKNRLKLARKSCRSFLGGAITQFGRDNNARTDPRFTNC